MKTIMSLEHLRRMSEIVYRGLVVRALADTQKFDEVAVKFRLTYLQYFVCTVGVQ